jgi:hypothetical protein
VPDAGVKPRGHDRRPTNSGIGKGILARVNADGLKALRILANERDTTLQALTVEALNDLLPKYDKRPTVKNPLIHGDQDRSWPNCSRGRVGWPPDELRS